MSGPSHDYPHETELPVLPAGEAPGVPLPVLEAARRVLGEAALAVGFPNDTEGLPVETLSLGEVRDLFAAAGRDAEARTVPASAYLRLLGLFAGLGITTEEAATTLPSADIDMLRRLGNVPSATHQDRLRLFTGEIGLILGQDAILVERTLSLMRPKLSRILWLHSLAGGGLSAVAIGKEMGMSTILASQHLSRAKREFHDIAAALQQGTFNLPEYAVRHCDSGTRRSVLTLLTLLEVPIPPQARFDELRGVAVRALSARGLAEQQLEWLRLLYGLDDGRVRTAQEVGKLLSVSPQAVSRTEKAVLRLPVWRRRLSQRRPVVRYAQRL